MKNLDVARDYIRPYGATLRVDGVILHLQYPSICGTAYLRWKFPLSQGGLLGACKNVRDYNQDICRPLPSPIRGQE